MTNLYRLLALAALPLLSACGNVVHGYSQDIHVSAVGLPAGSEATCKLENSRTAWSVQTPGVVSVDRSASPLRVICNSANGWEGRAELPSQPSEYSLAGNIAGPTAAGVGAGVWANNSPVLLGSGAAQGSALGLGLGVGLGTGVAGAAVDLHSGAAWRYPRSVQVAMAPLPHAMTPIRDAVARPYQTPDVVTVAEVPARPVVQHQPRRRHVAHPRGEGRPTK